MPALVMFVAEARLRIMSGNMSPGGRTCKDFIFVCLYFSGRCVYKGIVSLSCLCWCIITSNVTLIKTWIRYFFCAIVRSCHSIMSPWMFKSCTKFIFNYISTHSFVRLATYHIQESHLMSHLCAVRRCNRGNTKQHEGGLERLAGEGNFGHFLIVILVIKTCDDQHIVKREKLFSHVETFLFVMICSNVQVRWWTWAPHWWV